MCVQQGRYAPIFAPILEPNSTPLLNRPHFEMYGKETMSERKMHQFTQEERIKGAKSPKRTRKKMREATELVLKTTLKRGDIKDVEGILSLEEAQTANLDVQTAIIIAMAKKALLGDVQAAIYLRDTVGDKPSDKVEIDQSLTVEEWAKNHKPKL